MRSSDAPASLRAFGRRHSSASSRRPRAGTTAASSCAASAGLEAWGLTVRLGDHVNDRHGYMAGRDEDRAADLHAMLGDPEIRAIICLQGGYGTPRLIPLLDEALFAANPKAICGYSDLTTLHLAAEQWGDVISFYSNGASGVGAHEVTEYSKETTPPGALQRRAVRTDRPGSRRSVRPDDRRRTRDGSSDGWLRRAPRPGRSGRGSSPTSAAGSSVLEEIPMEGEVLDGILTHLRNAGLFEGAAGIVGRGHHDEAVRRPRRALGRGHRRGGPRRRSGCRSSFGLPIGHGKHHVTVPLGAMATLDADAGTLVVEEVVTAD